MRWHAPRRPTQRASKAGGRAGVRAQLPLAILMVGLTTLTLWSLGQNLVFEAAPERSVPAPTAAP